LDKARTGDAARDVLRRFGRRDEVGAGGRLLTMTTGILGTAVFDHADLGRHDFQLFAVLTATDLHGIPAAAMGLVEGIHPLLAFQPGRQRLAPCFLAAFRLRRESGLLLGLVEGTPRRFLTLAAKPLGAVELELRQGMLNLHLEFADFFRLRLTLRLKHLMLLL